MRLQLRRRWLWIFGAAALLAVIGTFAWSQWMNQQLADAQRAYRAGQWKRARESGLTYLWSHPADSRTRLLVAQAMTRDDSFTAQNKVRETLGHLQQIPDEAKESADARLLEGRLYLLRLLQPTKAEQCFRRSLKRDPQRLETHTLLWKLFNLTDRWDLAEEHFWQIYDQTPPEHRTSPLRDWYLSEFSAKAANIELDRFLGFLQNGSQPGSDTERRRLEAFVAADPECPEVYAVLARWYHRQRLQRPALELVEKAERLPGADQVDMLTGLRIAISLELGELDQARKAFEGWPEPRDGYEYWKAAGLVADQIDQEPRRASDAYAKAIQTKPGRADWRTQHRLAQCLTRLGQADEAAEVRKQAKEVCSLMEPAVHQGLRRALFTPRDPQTVGLMVEFYQKLGRSREVAAWKEVGELDRASVTGGVRAGRVTSSVDR